MTTEDAKVLIEFVGGPCDGERRFVAPEELLGRIVAAEQRREWPMGKRPLDRLRDGDVVPAADLERPDVIEHWYSRSERQIAGHGFAPARAYDYCPPEPV